jgi:hypothetical protein
MNMWFGRCLYFCCPQQLDIVGNRWTILATLRRRKECLWVQKMKFWDPFAARTEGTFGNELALEIAAAILVTIPPWDTKERAPTL